MSTEAKQIPSTGEMKAVKPQRRSHEARREESRARILDASQKLLVEKGYEGFSLQDVGRMAGCSHELVNHYFVNKDGLLSALAEHIVGAFSTDFSHMSRLPPGFENLAQQIRYVAAVADRNFLTFSAYMRIAADAPFHPVLSALITKRMDTTVSSFIDAIKLGQAAGDIRADINPEEFAGVIYVFLRGHTDVCMLLPHARSKSHALVDTFIELLRPALTVRAG